MSEKVYRVGDKISQKDIIKLMNTTAILNNNQLYRILPMFGGKYKIVEYYKAISENMGYYGNTFYLFNHNETIITLQNDVEFSVATLSSYKYVDNDYVLYKDKIIHDVIVSKLYVSKDTDVIIELRTSQNDVTIYSKIDKNLDYHNGQSLRKIL